MFLVIVNNKYAKNLLWALLLGSQVICYGSYAVLVHLTEVNGRIPFSSTAMNFLIEICKLIFSLAGFLYVRHHEDQQPADEEKAAFVDANNNHTNGSFSKLPDHHKRQRQLPNRFSFRNSLVFSVPAVLYFLNNNLAVYIQLFMDSTSYQMLSNLKIFTTAILYYFIMGRNMNRAKWFAIFLLFIAGVFYVYGNLNSMQAKQATPTSSNLTAAAIKPKSYTIYITPTGFVMILIYSFISGFSGVYSEYFLKKTFNDSIHLQNTYLYMYGAALNLLTCMSELQLLLDEGEGYTLREYFFRGFSSYVWLIIATQTLNGILMSIVMKHLTNITRLFVISCSLIVTTILSVAVFSIKLNAYFYFGFTSIMVALYIHNFY